MGNNFKYIVYVTVNIVNKKIYIGVHEAENPDKFDGYLGDNVWIDNPQSYNKGKTPLHNAILRHGIKNFTRITLKTFDNIEDALDLEKNIVTEAFVKRTDTYNTVVKSDRSNKPIYQFDKECNLIKEWESETEINKYYKCNVRFDSIIKNKQLFAKSFWSYDNKINNYQTEYKSGYIDQYSKEGILLNSFRNTTLASLKLDMDKDAITKSIFKKKNCFGYYFVNSGTDIAEILVLDCKVKSKKPMVYRYLRTREFDCGFPNIRQAARNTPRVGVNAINKAIINRNLKGGYYWSFKYADNYNDTM